MTKTFFSIDYTSMNVSSNGKALKKKLCFFSHVEHDDNATDDDLLDQVFRECNHGSPYENPQFAKCFVPSLSVGDTVTLGEGENKRRWLCESCGWSKISVDNPPA